MQLFSWGGIYSVSECVLWKHLLVQLRALSSELMVAGCFSENRTLSHLWVLENVSPEMRLGESQPSSLYALTLVLSSFLAFGAVKSTSALLYQSCSFCLSVNWRKHPKTQCQILQGLSMCIKLLCLGKVGIYKGSGVVWRNEASCVKEKMF